MMHTATIEFATHADPKNAPDNLGDDIVEALHAYHPAVSISPRHRVTVTITLPAENCHQAATTALALATRTPNHTVIAMEIVSERECDARVGWQHLPELVSVTEAAASLGVSRQAVLDRIRRGTVQATRIGESYAITRNSI